MKILCLHPWGTSGFIFERQLQPLCDHLGSTHEYVFINGPIPSPPARDIPDCGKPPYFCWYEGLSSKQCQLAHDTIAETIKEEGPFDGVIGFSQGAAVAISFLLHHRIRNPGAASPFGFGLFFCPNLVISPDPDFGSTQGSTTGHELDGTQIYQLGNTAHPELDGAQIYQLGNTDPELDGTQIYQLGNIDPVINDEHNHQEHSVNTPSLTELRESQTPMSPPPPYAAVVNDNSGLDLSHVSPAEAEATTTTTTTTNPIPQLSPTTTGLRGGAAAPAPSPPSIVTSSTTTTTSNTRTKPSKTNKVKQRALNLFSNRKKREAVEETVNTMNSIMSNPQPGEFSKTNSLLPKDSRPEDFPGIMHPDVLSYRISIPTVHVLAEDDPFLRHSELAVQLCDKSQAKVIYVKGPHRVPTAPGTLRMVVGAVEAAVQRGRGG